MKHSTLLYYWLLLAASFVTGIVHGQSLPTAHGHINDLKGMLSPAATNDLEMRLRTFRDSNTVELAVVIMDLPDGEDHQAFTNTLARTWGIGSKEADNGALLAVYPNVRKARIEVGYGLEPVLTDAMCAIILADKVVPNLKNNDYDAAVTGAVEEMMRLSSKEFRAQIPHAKPTGDGGEGFIVAGILLMFVGLPILFFIGSRQNNRRNRNNRNNRNDNNDGGGYYSGPIILGGDSGSSWSSGGDSGSSGGGSSGGGSSGGGSDFGGFSGGDFGGGGASSDW